MTNGTNSTVTNVTRNAATQNLMYVGSSQGPVRYSAGDAGWMPTAVLGASQSSGYLTLDAVHDRLYVVDTGSNSVNIYDAVSTLAVNAPPTRVLGGPTTGLNAPVQVQVDSAHHAMYVANSGSDAVTVYPEDADGDAAPNRTFTSAQVTAISSISLEATRDRLWIADPAKSTLTEFDSASQLTGSCSPTRTVNVASSPLYVDSAGANLYVSIANAILRFADDETLTGAATPAATITEGGLQNPTQLSYRAGADELYACDIGSKGVLKYTFSSGIPVASRLLQASDNGLSALSGLALAEDR